MVKTLNITLDDEVWEKANEIKNERDLTWPEYIEVAADELERAREPDPEPGLKNTKKPDIDFDEDIDLPGSGNLYERRRQTILELADLLRDRGSATKSDFLEIVDPDKVGYASKESFWSNCVKGRKSLKGIPQVEPPEEGKQEWRWK